MPFYSEKVLEHFKNPRNVGEIENPDGVGDVGNPVCGDIMTFYIKVKDNILEDVKFKTYGCLPTLEKVITNPVEIKEINKIKKGDKVLNSLGETTFIAETYKRNFTGELVRIVPFVSPYNTITLTRNHPVLCIKRKWVENSRPYGGKCKWIRIEEDNLLSQEPDFVQTKDIETGDYLVYVYNTKVEDNEIFNLSLMRLLGYYLAGGYITANGSIVCFSFNKKEKDIIEEVKDLIYSICKKKAKERIRNNAAEVYVCSRKFVRFLIHHCGKYARFKKLSEDIIHLPFEKQLEMIKTYLAGDGDSYKRRKIDSKTYRIITTSEILAIQIQQILARGGIFTSIREIWKRDCYIEGRKLLDSKQFLISFKLEKKHKFVHLKDKYFLVPVRKVEYRNYSGKVYNFQVAFEPNTYLVKGFVVHNCGAAIAVSSIVSEMAKGKTIEEAMKITNKIVAQELGGLPPNKLHCSNLGADALHKAIEDYLQKQKGRNEKREIQKEKV